MGILTEDTSKKIIHWTVAGAVVLIVAAFGAMAYALLSQKPTVTAGGRTFEVEVANTPEQQATGLSGRKQLGKNRGMLFVFEQDDFHVFWMKDMQFAIDIIWIDGDRRVAHIERDVQPDGSGATYKPARKARYVLEVASGQADAVVDREGVIFGGGV